MRSTRDRNRHTYTLTAILRSSPGRKVKYVGYVETNHYNHYLLYLYLVPLGGNVTSAGRQVTLSDPIECMACEFP